MSEIFERDRHIAADLHTKILVDGRVFSTAAFDRGMGVYLRHVISTLDAAGFDVSILIFRDCRLDRDDPILSRHSVRFANFAERFEPDPRLRVEEIHRFTAYLTALIEQDGYDVFLDGTPFLGPLRLDLFSCAVVAICYDFIPLRHPSYYLPFGEVRSVYQNGLTRLAHADGIICISDTVRTELQKYLGFDADRIVTIQPRLDKYYETSQSDEASPFARSYLFSILGGHKSKNPERALSILGDLSSLVEMDVRLNAPTPDQHAQILERMLDHPNLFLTGSISEVEKHVLQTHAACIAHLSIEEGFGIPCLEAIFLGRKIIVLDVPINRELMAAGWDYRDGAVLLLPPDAARISADEFRNFLRQPASEEFYQHIKAHFRAEWAAAPERITALISCARDNFVAWQSRIKAAIFSSLPGSSCGVADYTAAYVRSAPFDVMVFCSASNQEYLTPVTNTRVGTYLDFARFRAHYPSITCMFNFAFSDELFPGIDLMRAHAEKGDVVLVHERRYFDGLLAMMVRTGRIEELLLNVAGDESPERKNQLALRCAFDPLFNVNSKRISKESPITSAWLQEVPARFVSHLSPPVLAEMRALAEVSPGDVVNDLADIESSFHFVALGIDDRSSPGVARAARQLRLLRGIQPKDVLVGHFGLILNDLKRLWDVVSATVAFVTDRERRADDGRRLFFALVGKVIDEALFAQIGEIFAEAGLADRLIHTNPALETDFDAEIAACDGIFCFRTQQRGQLSHVYVRSLSLGVPNFVNTRSGYAYDARTTIRDDDVTTGIAHGLESLFDQEMAVDMRRSARRAWETTHRGDRSLDAIMNGNRDE